MKEVIAIIESLERTPIILELLLEHIPLDLYSERRISNKWTIHEQVCHLVEAQEILRGRFLQFSKQENPLIKSYIPPTERGKNYYLNLNLEEQRLKFPEIRKELIQMLKDFKPLYWKLTGRHEMYEPYSTKILLTHTLNVDYAHIFSIEQLGLTKFGMEKEIMTIP